MSELKYQPTNHSYYCSPKNYTCSNASLLYPTWKEFLAEFENADKDRNMVFRFDIELLAGVTYKYPEYIEDKTADYCIEDGDLMLSIFFMQQRKGHYVPVVVERIERKDMPSIQKYLQGHFDYMKNLWSEFA